MANESEMIEMFEVMEFNIEWQKISITYVKTTS